MPASKRPLWIMVSGPYASGVKTQAERDAKLREMNKAALAVFGKGHIPVIGVNNALPLIAVAGKQKYAAIMMPLSLALADRCDACLRIDGVSQGADEEAERFRAAGKPVYRDIDEVPAVNPGLFPGLPEGKTDNRVPPQDHKRT